MRAILIEPTTRVDVSAAQRYGEIVYIFEKNESRPSIWTEEFVQVAMIRLEQMNYDPKADTIIIAGAIVPLIKLIGCLTANFGRIRVLCHSAIERDYTLQEIGQCIN